MTNSKELPIVSVVTLIYNNEKYTIESLECIRNQTYHSDKIDHIIINDCSPGDDSQIRQWIKENDYRCRYLKHEKNRGICASLNHFLRLAKGKYWFGISDDLVGDDFIKRRVNFIESQDDDLAMCFSPVIMCYEDSGKEELYIPEIKNRYIYFEDLLVSNSIPSVSAFTSTDAVKNIGYYDESLIYEDFDMWLRISQKYKIAFFEKNDVKYRRHPNSFNLKIIGEAKHKTLFIIFNKYRSLISQHPIIEKKIHYHAMKLSQHNTRLGIVYLKKALNISFKLSTLKQLLKTYVKMLLLKIRCAY